MVSIWHKKLHNTTQISLMCERIGIKMKGSGTSMSSFIKEYL